MLFVKYRHDVVVVSSCKRHQPDGASECPSSRQVRTAQGNVDIPIENGSELVTEEFSKAEKDTATAQLHPHGDFDEDAAHCFLGMMRALTRSTVTAVAKRALDEGRDRIDPSDLAKTLQQDEPFRRLLQNRPSTSPPPLDSIRGTCIVIEGPPQCGAQKLVDRMCHCYETNNTRRASIGTENSDIATDVGEDGSVAEDTQETRRRSSSQSINDSNTDVVMPGKFVVPSPPENLGLESYAWVAGLAQQQMVTCAKTTNSVLVQGRGTLSAYVLSSYMATINSNRTSGWIPGESSTSTIKVFIDASPSSCFRADSGGPNMGLKNINDHVALHRLYFEAVSHLILEDASIDKVGSRLVVIPFRHLETGTHKHYHFLFVFQTVCSFLCFCCIFRYKW